VARYKRTLALTIEGRLKAIDKAVASALPLQTVKMGPRTMRGLPRLTHPADPIAVEKAETLLVFMNEVRPNAASGGFASAITKTLEALEQRLDSYVESVLEELRADDGVDPEFARAFLDIAATFCGLIRGEQSAQIVRRRAAAA
jgi:hypothetical protein